MNTRLQESIQLCSSKVYSRLVAFLERMSKHSLPARNSWSHHLDSAKGQETKVALCVVARGRKGCSGKGLTSADASE